MDRLANSPGVRVAILALAVMSVPMAARAGCAWDDLVQTGARVAIVQPQTARTGFVKDAEAQPGCPNDTAICRQSAYLTPNDIVLTGPVQGRYTCAGFVGTRGAATIGWLPTAALTPASDADQHPDDWSGHWVAPEQDVTIAATATGAFSVKGNATWGGRDPDRVARGGVNIGEIAGTPRPDHGMLAFAMGASDAALPYASGDRYTCRVRMLRRGPYLMVHDNMACGGVNVTFSGLYRRKD